MVACPPIRKSPFPARPRSPSIRAWRKARLKLWPSPKENTVQRSRSPISGITPETSALAWTPPSKIKLAAIGKNDFGQIDSILNPDVGERLQQAPRRRRNETRARGNPREFSVLSYLLSIKGESASRSGAFPIAELPNGGFETVSSPASDLWLRGASRAKAAPSSLPRAGDGWRVPWRSRRALRPCVPWLPEPRRAPPRPRRKLRYLALSN